MTGRFLAGAALSAFMAGGASAEFTLHILHTNDIHSRIESINRFDSTCDAEGEAEGECFGGVARVATKVAEMRDAMADQNLLVLDAGDPFQGSLFYTTYKGAAEAEFMDAIGYDVMAVGNHEFDDGPQGLADFVDAVSFPVISGNLDLSQSNLLNGKVDNHVVLEVGGKKVGIISALATNTSETSSPGPNVIFQDEIDSLQADVDALTEQGVDIVIALNHVGLPMDRRIAESVDGLDLIVGGHSHTLMSNDDPDTPPYPEVVNDTPIVQAYAYTKYLGHVTVTFDDDGHVMSASGDPILLDASVEPNADMVARIAEMAAPIEALKAQSVGMANEVIDGSRENCRAVECAMGNLVADAMLARTQNQGIQIAIQNGGGLRASIDAGEITMGEVLTVLPFQNTLATFQLSGADIVAALENGVSEVEEGAGRFPQVAGLHYTWNPEAEPGSRITSVMVNEGGTMAAIDADTVYGVVTNNYMRSGGDGYSIFATNGQNAYDYGPGLEIVVADYLAEKLDEEGGYTPYLDGRISVAQ